MENSETKLDLRRLFLAIKRCKWIYLAFIVCFTGLGIWLSVRSLPKYTIEGSLLIGDTSYESETKGAGGLSQMMKTFSVGGFSGSSVDNEILILSSHDVMLRTSRKLGLNRTYTGTDTDGPKKLLYHDTPVRIEAPVEYFDTLSKQFNIKIKINDNGTVDLKAVKGFFGTTIAEKKGVNLPTLLETPYGNLQVMPTESFSETKYKKLTVKVCSNYEAAIRLNQTTKIDVAEKLADVINVDLKYANAEYGKAIVNGIMREYNAKRIDRVHESSETSIQYYDERIAQTFSELEKTEQAIAQYKRSKELSGAQFEPKILLTAMHETKAAIVQANDEIAYFDMVLRTLRNRLKEDALIPQIENLSDTMITVYNDAILERRELKRSATDNNRTLQLMNEKIATLRDMLIENSEKAIDKARHDVKTQQSIVNSAENRLNEYPTYELEYENLLRDKILKNALYQYLVQERENSVLQLYKDTDMGFIFQDAYIYQKPSIIPALIWPAIFFLFAIFAATCVALLLMLMSRKVKHPTDLSFIHISDHTVTCDGNRAQLTPIRTSMLGHGSRRIIYSADLTGNHPSNLRLLSESLTAAGRRVEIMDNVTDTDTLLTPEFNTRLEKLTYTDSDNYTLVEMPDAESLCEIADIIDKSDAQIVIWIPYNKADRKYVKKVLKGQTADRVYAVIMK